MKKLLYGLLAFSLFSCGRGGKPAGLLTENDFETLDGWTNGGANVSLNKERAHSGSYSVKVNPGLDYSMGYVNTMGKLSPARISKLKVHGWVFVPNDKATATLVTEIKNPGQEKSAFWDGIGLVEQAKQKGYNKWIEVERELTLPAEITYNSQVMLYLWRGDSSQPVYLDDVQISKAD